MTSFTCVVCRLDVPEHTSPRDSGAVLVPVGAPRMIGLRQPRVPVCRDCATAITCAWAVAQRSLMVEAPQT